MGTNIDRLTAASEIAAADLFEVQQSGVNKKLTVGALRMQPSGIYAVAASYTILDDDGYTDFLIPTAAATYNFDIPTAAANVGRKLFFKKLDSGAGKITFTFEGGEDEVGVSVLANKGAFLWIVSDGTDWYILNHRDIYNSGWVENALGGVGVGDWVDVLITITHNLNANLSDLIAKFFISSDSAGANAWEKGFGTDGGGASLFGCSALYVDLNSFAIQTGEAGLLPIGNNPPSPVCIAKLFRST